MGVDANQGFTTDTLGRLVPVLVDSRVALLECGTGSVHAVNERIAHAWRCSEAVATPRGDALAIRDYAAYLNWDGLHNDSVRPHTADRPICPLSAHGTTDCGDVG